MGRRYSPGTDGGNSIRILEKVEVCQEGIVDQGFVLFLSFGIGKNVGGKNKYGYLHHSWLTNVNHCAWSASDVMQTSSGTSGTDSTNVL